MLWCAGAIAGPVTELSVSETDIDGAMLVLHAHRFEIGDNVQGTLVLTADSLYFTPAKREGDTGDQMPLSDIVRTGIATSFGTSQETRLYVVTNGRVIDFRVPTSLVGRILQAIGK